MSKTEIIDLVKACQSPPCRPELLADSCSREWRELVSQCWDNDPHIRPTFKEIKKALRALLGGRFEYTFYKLT